MKFVARIMCLTLVLAGSNVLAAEAFANTFVCEMSQLRGNSSSALYGVRGDTTCSARVVFSDGVGGSTSRIVGCIIRDGERDCSIGLSDLTVPNGWLPAEVYAQAEVPPHFHVSGCVPAENDYPRVDVDISGAVSNTAHNGRLAAGDYVALAEPRFSDLELDRSEPAAPPVGPKMGFSIKISHRFQCMN